VIVVRKRLRHFHTLQSRPDCIGRVRNFFSLRTPPGLSITTVDI